MAEDDNSDVEITSDDLDARWSKNVLRKGFVAVPTVLLRNFWKLREPLTAMETIFLINLVDYIRAKTPAFPSNRRLANDLGISVADCTSLMDSLVDKSYVERSTAPLGGGSLTVYSVEGIKKELAKHLE